MFAKLKNEKPGFALLFRNAPALALSFLFAAFAANAQTVSSSGQTETADKTVQEKTADAKMPMPVLKNYREVAIGMTADEVKAKLGKAEVADKDGFYYEFSDGETAQIVLDADQKVRAISITYKVKSGNAPKLEDVLGTDPSIEPNADGAVYRLVRYPEAGFWVAYNRTAGDDATVSVTIQKL